MNRISIYILLILVYLGISHSFSLSDKGTIFVKNRLALQGLFKEGPVCVILIDSFQTGFLIKTYYHKYSVVFGLQQPREILVRTSIEFSKENAPNIGMSIFRRDENPRSFSYVPMPPGILFVGNPAYGTWVNDDSGQKIWSFYRIYRYLVKLLGWGYFRPNFNFYKRSLNYLEKEVPFYGFENEFGTNGFLTRQSFPDYFEKSVQRQMKFKDFLKKIIEPKFSRKLL